MSSIFVDIKQTGWRLQNHFITTAAQISILHTNQSLQETVHQLPLVAERNDNFGRGKSNTVLPDPGQDSALPPEIIGLVK